MGEEKKDNSVFIGQKPFMVYVYASNQVLEKYNECVIKARSKNIIVAVNLAEFLKKKTKFTESVKIGTEVVKGKKEGEEGKEFNVSTIEIILKK